MGRLEDFHTRLAGKRVYVDTNIFVSVVEGAPDLMDAALILGALRREGGVGFVTSELTLCELLAAPLKRGDALLAGQYSALLEGEAIELASTTRPIYGLAAQVRARLGLKTPDAVHMATALSHGCDVLLTQDQGFKPADGLEIVSMPPNGT